MALSAETKTQNATGTGGSALGLLASLKAGLKGVKSGGFDALLAAVDNALPQQTPDLPAKEKDVSLEAGKEERAALVRQEERKPVAADEPAAPKNEVAKAERKESTEEKEEAASSEEQTAAVETEVNPAELEAADQGMEIKEEPLKAEESFRELGEGNVSEEKGAKAEDAAALLISGQLVPREAKPTGASPVEQGDEAEFEGDLDADTALETNDEDGSTWGALLGFSQEARESKADAFAGAWRVSSGVPADTGASTLPTSVSEDLTLSQDSSLTTMAANMQTQEATTDSSKAKTPLETFFGLPVMQSVEEDVAVADATGADMDLQSLLSRRGGVPASEASVSSQPAQLMAQNAAQATSQTAAIISEARAAPASAASMPTGTIAGIGSGARAGSSYHFAMLHAEATSGQTTTSRAEIVEQVSVQLRKMAKDGTSEMTIQLRPEELGEIEIKLEFKEDKKVQGTIIAEKASTLQLLQKDSDALQRVLQDAGLQADSGSLEFSLRDGSRDSASTWGEAEGGESAFFADDVFVPEQAEVQAEEIYYVTPQRVNLRV